MPQSSVRIDSNGLKNKMKRLEDLIGDSVEEQIMSLASYGVQISPVQSGAYVRSFQVNPRGSRAGRRIDSSTLTKLTSPAAKQDAKEDAKAQVRADVVNKGKAIIESGGVTITNFAPHSRIVELRHGVFAKMINRFR
jgi:hypothetical protein